MRFSWLAITLLSVISTSAVALDPGQRVSTPKDPSPNFNRVVTKKIDLPDGPGGLVLGNKSLSDFLPNVTDSGDMMLLPGRKIGRVQDGKFVSQTERLEIQGTGSNGDASQFSAKPEAEGGQFYGLAERMRDEVSVMEYIPPQLRPAIRDYTSTTDLTPYLRKAAATGKRVRYVDGRYPVCDSLPLAPGQEMVGPGVTAAYLWVSSCFNLSAPAVVKVALGESSGLDGLGIKFDQSAANASVVPVPLGIPPDIGGTWNATANTPTLSANSPYFAGTYLTVSTPGTQFGISWAAGDHIISAGPGVPWRKVSPGSANFEFAAASTNARAALVKYPPALDISLATRFKLGRVRISGAWDGILCAGNCGGTSMGMVEVSAFNRPIWMYGAYDFVLIDTLHLWGFDVAGTTLESVLYDGKVTAEFGRVDGLFIRNLAPFNTKVMFNENGGASAARIVQAVMLDGDGSVLQLDRGDLQVGVLSSTKNGSPAPWPANAVVMGSNAGTMGVGSIRCYGATQGSTWKQNGGYLTINGGYCQQLRGDFAAMESSQGIMQVQNVQFDTTPTIARSVGLVASTGGAIIAKGNVALPRAATGPFIALGSDLAQHTIQNNDFDTMFFSLPFGARLGEYGPNKVAPFTWAPTPAFDGGNGTFSVSAYPVRQGTYSYGAGKIDYAFRVYFIHGSYSGNSGNFVLGGLPFYASTIDFAAGVYAELGGFTLTAGQLWAPPVVRADSSKPGIYGFQLGGQAAAFLNASNVPTAAGTRYISGSGSIPLR